MRESNQYNGNRRKILFSENISLNKWQMDAEWDQIAQMAFFKRQRQRRQTIYKALAWGSASAAAAILILIMLFNGPSEINDTIAPGKIFAQLETPSGKNYSLDSLSAQDLKSLGIIERTTESLQTEAHSFAGPQPEIKEIETVRIDVPLYSEYKLTLADSSVVMLNSGASIEFTKDFLSKPREVRLQGEAFFKVTKRGNTPFTVITPECSVVVLGTEFNVNNSNGVTTTSLVKGSVEIKAGNQTTLLQPGKMALAQQGRDLEINTFDIESVTAWTRGEIIFKERRLEDIVNDLCRWYNVAVVFADMEAKDLKFSLFMTRTVYFEEIMRTLEKTEKIKVKIINNQVSISMS